MLEIKREQKLRLEGPARDQFARRLLPYLYECHAHDLRGLSEDEIIARADAAIARARRHGLRREASIALFVGIAFHIGPSFDEQPTVRRVLADPRRPPDARLAALADETTAEDWNEARTARRGPPATTASMIDFSSWSSYGWPVAVALGVVACAAWFGSALWSAGTPCPTATPAVTPPPISPTPPVVPDRHYLTLPQVAAALGVPPLDSGDTGAGTRVAIIDSGFYRHPYFDGKGFDIKGLQVTQSDDGQALGMPSNPFEDNSGHGTSMVANVLAVAPETEVTMVRSPFFNASLRAAIQQDPPPDVISISNCSSYEQLLTAEQVSDARAGLAALIEEANAKNIIIVCCSGNAGRHTVLGSLPGVITVGGVYVDEGGTLVASDYANGTLAGPNRLPDICGICGPMPLGQYIMLPTAPGSSGDRSMSEHGDGTAPDDGWTLASGTSSATPQVAAICALLRQRNPHLTTAEVREILRATATPVNAGQSHDGVAADGDWSRLPNATATLHEV